MYECNGKKCANPNCNHNCNHYKKHEFSYACIDGYCLHADKNVECIDIKEIRKEKLKEINSGKHE